MNILVINSGSSSIKYQLINIVANNVLFSGIIERIGQTSSTISHCNFTQRTPKEVKDTTAIASHKEGLEKISKLLNTFDIKAVGHRVVHGGEVFSKTTIINQKVKNEIKKLYPLAPLHNPANLQGIKVAEKVFDKAIQIAVFDTAFHQTIPQKAFRYAIPNEFYTKYGIRKYGFHGTSHKYVSKKAIEYLSKPNAKIITIHLGNGCSMAAINDGKCIDTTMGMGPLSGLVMGTRCGDLDPSIIFYMVHQLGYSIEETSDILNKKSGMLGLTGFSDMRDIRANIEKNDENNLLASQIYNYNIQKMIGAYTVALNGLDAIVFTAGVGENDIQTRRGICENMQVIGIEIDLEKNNKKAKKIIEVQSEKSKVKILVIPTNEELEIAKQTYELITTIL